MRTIDQIKESITSDFMRNEAAASIYGFTPGDNFYTYFSKLSVESVLFYIVAAAAWVQESMFEALKREISAIVENILPHRPKWYRDKVLAFMKDYTLIPDTDKYNTSGLSDVEIEAARVVKHAVATENMDASILTIKVAGEIGGKRCPLDAKAEIQLAAYIAEIKDAGVRIGLMNIAPDTFNCEMDIYYDPLMTPTSVEQACRDAIQAYVENLPFNGEYTNMQLVDALQEQKDRGVKIVEFKTATSSVAGQSVITSINARCIPAAGYFKLGTVVINMIAYNG